MSGGSVPYHLRQNKAIERNLFMELLVKLNRVRKVSKYTYVGFGGPFLEDFKLIHTHFGNTRMISLEYDESVFQRQLFNLPLGCIECRQSTSGEFIDSYNIEGNAIIWLDYAEAGKIGDQTREFNSLLRKLQAYDILKITVNANPDCYGNPLGATAVEKREKRLQKLRSTLAGNLPADVSSEDMDLNGFPLALCKVLQYSVSSAMRGRFNEIFKPLTSYTYTDSTHQMLTLTGIILPKECENGFLETTTINEWNLATKNWGMPQRIRVPELTIKERGFIDSKLPLQREDEIHNDLTFRFDVCEDKSLSYLADYIKYYRHYPYFSKILV